MRRVGAQRVVALAPDDAIALWRDLSRWPSFIEGFGSVQRGRGDWPQQGSQIVWRSVPGGRGDVTEKVVESNSRVFATLLYEHRLHGTQRAVFAPAPDADGTRVELSLEYELTSEAPLRSVLDFFYVSRTVRTTLVGQLGRFAIEASEDAGLR